MLSRARNCLLLFTLMTLGLCQQEYPESRNATESEAETLTDDEPKTVSQPPKSTAKATSVTHHYHNNHHQKLKHRNKDHFVDSRRQRLPIAGSTLPIFALNNNFEEVEPIGDFGGRYNIRLHHYQPQNPSDFNAALGAISAHIVSQKSEADDYIPYPPNGDPYNYPPYLGHPQATEPPVIRAYETASNANNFGPQTAPNFNRFDSRIYRNNGYGFPGHHDNVGFNFYNDRSFFQGEGGGFISRNVEPVEELRSLFQERETQYGRPLTRVANL